MIKFLVDLYKETIPQFITIKYYIDLLLDMEPFKTMAILSSIVGAICFLPQLPKIVDRLIRKISTWGRY